MTKKRIRLKLIRELNGLKQKEIAGLLGIDPSLVSRWEKGDRNINTEHKRRLSEILNADKEALFKEDFA